jgi:hypothetical protein
MGTIAVSVDGRPIFSWDGDEDAIKNVIDNFPIGAEGVGLSAIDFATACIAHLSGRALRKQERVGQEMQMMGVIWFILQMDTDKAGRPGKIKDYAENTDFTVDLHVDVAAGKITADIDAATWFNA